jgi:DNA sulfur modification protein DndE
MTKSKGARPPAKNTSGESAKRLELTQQRIWFSATVDNKMRQLRARTGITPNILARFGFCLSLEEPGDPGDPFRGEKATREINRGTLLGEHDAVYIALFRTWVSHNRQYAECSAEEFNRLFVAHMNRGFELLSARMRGLADLLSLVGRQPTVKND